ncbi:MAG: ACT domain-containing protein, partial [Clostridia bacterium]|nr:ACT domain-containing protein [Clostridia bacterium]
IDIQYNGDIASHNVSILSSYFLVGLLKPILDTPVNLVNAPHIAKTRGIKLHEIKTMEMEDFTNLITVTVKTDNEERSFSGTVFSEEPRIVRINGYSIDAVPEGHMLVTFHTDKPKIVGPVATALGEYNINIASMQVGRESQGGKAIMFLSVDSEVPQDTLEEISRVDGIADVKYVYL